MGRADCIDVLPDLFSQRGLPGHVGSENGPEFIAETVRGWTAAVGSQTAYIEPDSPWENGYCEGFNATLRNEFLDGEVFHTLKEASVVIERWRKDDNTIRPHSSPAKPHDRMGTLLRARVRQQGRFMGAEPSRRIGHQGLFLCGQRQDKGAAVLGPQTGIGRCPREITADDRIRTLDISADECFDWAQ